MITTTEVAELYEQRAIAAHTYVTTNDVRRRIIAHAQMGWIDEQIAIARIREMRSSCPTTTRLPGVDSVQTREGTMGFRSGR